MLMIKRKIKRKLKRNFGIICRLLLLEPRHRSPIVRVRKRKI